ncbi:alpha/beta hydrolase [Lentzea sp. NBRC 105346]|uniref:alpha/beta fold hydrolase n=1 Tax=Lentzea sp. NBRC 105346 TaxID=3032205 RepID=UPI0024A2F498|nr:alpha/beta hydrolase [Lentzea sp. NBRC 105346]GLZ35967.1 alpha/beta hydrolase [Lentzea sp. NBRC 105346]
MGFVEANGIRLHYQRQPHTSTDRPTVVCLHGLADTLAGFYFTLVGPLAQAGFDVITYDLRGHGRSDQPTSGYTIGDHLDDLTGLLDELGVTGPLHVLGFSFGGTLAFSFAERFPARMLTLTVIESEPPTKAWARRTSAGFGKLDTVLLDEVFVRAQPRVLRRMAQSIMTAGETSVAVDTVAPEWLISSDEIRKITCPVHLVVGGDSELSRHTEEFVPLLPDVTVNIVPGEEHMVLTSSPREVAALVVPWLAAR